MATCLDGSQGSFYIKRGDPKNIMVFFQGGGWCLGQSKEDAVQQCTQRASYYYGSSNYNQNESYILDVFLENTNGRNRINDDQNNNEQNKNIENSEQGQNRYDHFTLIRLSYCDGLGYQGYKQKPYQSVLEDTKLEIRGRKIATAFIDYLVQNLDFSIIENFYINGLSAGAVAALQWVDHYREQINYQNSKINVRGIIQSGIFPDMPSVVNKRYNYRESMKIITEHFMQEKPFVVKGCQQKYKDELWRCMFTEYLHPFVKTPLLFIQSYYDNWVTSEILNNYCYGECQNQDQKIQMEELGLRQKATMKSILQNNPKNGIIAIDQFNHVLDLYSIYQDVDFQDLIHKWTQGQEVAYFQDLLQFK